VKVACLTFQLGKRKARSLSRFLTLPVENRTCHFNGIRLSTFDSSPWGDHEASVPISPVPQVSTRVQLARSLGTFVSLFSKARGLRLQSSSWCTWLSHAPTTMPLPTPVRTSGISLGSRLPTLHFPCHSSQVSRVHNEGLKRNAVGGVLLNAPSPLWGSPIFLQGRVRLTWSPITDHPMQSSLVLTLHKKTFQA
jgi:hypothetical protein